MMSYDQFLEKLDRKLFAQEHDHPPLRYVVIALLAICVLIRYLFVAWDTQIDDLFKQQQAMEQACERAGGVVTSDGCRGLRKRGN